MWSPSCPLPEGDRSFPGTSATSFSARTSPILSKFSLADSQNLGVQATLNCAITNSKRKRRGRMRTLHVVHSLRQASSIVVMGKKRPKQRPGRPRKRKFQGNQFASLGKSRSEDEFPISQAMVHCDGKWELHEERRVRYNSVLPSSMYSNPAFQSLFFFFFF